MSHPRILLLAASAVALSGAFFTGCQSTTASSPALTRGATASSSFQSAAETVDAARAQIKQTLAALRNLTERPADVPAQYEVVRKQLDQLASATNKLTAAADAMRAKGDAYLTDWAKKVAVINDPELRDAALGRRAEVSATLQKTFTTYQTVKSELVPFQAHLSDIQRSLSSDLTLPGLEAVKPIVAKASAAAEPLTASLDKLAGEFRAVGLSLQPGAAGL